MRIPEIRDRLKEIAAESGNSEIASLADELTRRPARKRAPNESAPFTEELAREIRKYAASHPNMSQAAVAKVFRVNPGRVSEATRGYRH